MCYCWMMLRVEKRLNEDPGPLPGHRCLGALMAESSSEIYALFGTCNCYRWTMFRVDIYSNKDPGPFS